MKNKPYPYYEVGEYNTLQEFLKYISDKYENNIAFKFTKKKQDIEKTYKDFYIESNSLAKQIIAQGFEEEHIGVLGENSYEWILAYMAVAISKNVIAPIDKDLDFGEIVRIVKDAEIKLLFCSNTYDDYIASLKVELPELMIINLNDIGSLIEKGKVSDVNLPLISANDISTIIYTSGTTGNPKGVVLTHKSLCVDARGCAMQFCLTGDSVLVLPLHHTFSFTVNILFALNCGFAVCIPSSLKRIDEALKKYKPRSMILVPMIVESFCKRIYKEAKNQRKSKTLKIMTFVSNILRSIGLDFRKVFFKNVISAFGGNLDLIICGGAPLETEYVKKLRTFGINVYNGFGITECSPVVSVNRNNYFRDGSVGTVLPGVEVKIDEKDGEILVKGNNVMLGYYKDDASTKSSVDNGYFKTGDIGYIDNDGFLFITGRKKNIIILENGKNVYPEELENKLQLKSGIKEVVIYAENDKITAEIYPDLDEIPKNITVDEYIKKVIDDFNKSLPFYKKILEFKIRDKEFEKTTTKKIKRSHTNVR